MNWKAQATVSDPWSACDWMVVAFIAAITLSVFGQVVSHSFIGDADDSFIFDNPHVLGGNVVWALTSPGFGWGPLTWLSHMLDFKIWGMRPGLHILTGVFLHTLSAIILFAVLRRMTSARWPSAFVAVLFAIHPMHVESVAWASERKDTLSTLFAMLALWFYARVPRRMLNVAIAMALSLAAKQMYVTLPFVFLLLDYWPLNRLRTPRDLRKRVIEKWPLFALTIIGAATAVVSQERAGAIRSLTEHPIPDRIGNVLLSYVRYIGKLFVPVDMVFPYAWIQTALSVTVASGLALLAVTIAVFAARRSAPYLAVGWLWFIGSLVPAIGIITIGTQSIADRYTYFPYVGLFIAIAFGGLNLARRLRIPHSALATTAGVIVAVYAVIALHQVRYWQNFSTLFEHTLATSGGEKVYALTSLGTGLLRENRPSEAVPHLRRAIGLMQGRRVAILLEYYRIKNNLMLCRGAMALAPEEARGLAQVEEEMGDNCCKTGMRLLALNYFDATNGLMANIADAGDEFRHAVAIAPNSINAHCNLGLWLVMMNQYQEGIAELRSAQVIDSRQANNWITEALRMAPNDGNLDAYIESAVLQSVVATSNE